MSDRKPRNYFDELTQGQQEEKKKLDAMAAETERYRKIGEAVTMFENFQRWLEYNNNTVDSEEEEEEEEKPARSIPKIEVDPMPPRPRRRRIDEGPLLEEVMLTRGILQRRAL